MENNLTIPDYKKVQPGDWIFTCSMQPFQFKAFDEPKKESDYDRSKFTDEEWERFSKYDDFETMEGSCHSSKNCSLKIISAEYAKWFIDNKIWEHFDKENSIDGETWDKYETKVKQLAEEAGIKYEGY